MKILFLHSGSRVPSSRFRVLPMVVRLRQMGFRCTVASSFPQKYDYFPWLGFRPSQFLKRWIRRWHLFRARLGRYDVIVIDRELFDDDSVWCERRFRRLAPALVIDVDDAIFLRHPDKYPQLAELADHMIVGNRFLADYTRPFNDRLTVIPTCIEMDQYPEVQRDESGDGPVVVGWIGTSANIPYLSVVAPAMRAVAKRLDYELRVVAPASDSLQSLDLTGVNVRFEPWDSRAEVQQISSFHIGLMPLVSDDQWSRYKCGLKLLQYMAVGLPAIASPVGVNADIVTHGVDGFLAETTEEWEQALVALISDAELRQQMGSRARQVVINAYSVEANLPRYVEVLEQALQHGLAIRNAPSCN